MRVTLLLALTVPIVAQTPLPRPQAPRNAFTQMRFLDLKPGAPSMKLNAEKLPPPVCSIPLLHAKTPDPKHFNMPIVSMPKGNSGGQVIAPAPACDDKNP